MEVAMKKNSSAVETASIEEALSLLRAKNRCLERVLRLCSGFLDRWESLSEDAKSRELARLQEKRGSHFRVLELYDERITQTLRRSSGGAHRLAVPHGEKTAEPSTEQLLPHLQEVLNERSRLVREIIDQDNQIMLRLESEKNRVIEELAGTRKNQSLVNKFKSGWVAESGEGLDQKL
jgi:hypothetical protein